MPSRLRGLVLGLAALAIMAGCEPTLDTRTALIIQTLVDSDRDLIATRPELVATKYEAMTAGPQSFLRGTAVLFYRDLGRYQDEQAALLHGPGAEQVTLYGDPHLENVGATFDERGALLDVIDFDATVIGPFGWDLRRAALAMHTAFSFADLSDEISAQAVRAFLAAYSEAVVAASEGHLLPPLRVGEEGAGRIFSELLADDQKRYVSREELTEYTQVVGGQRVFLRSERLAEVPQPFSAELPQLIDRYRDSLRSGRGDDSRYVILDAVQRFGTGIASLPNVRLWVLVRGEGEGAEWLLELKEQRDPPAPVAWLGQGARGVPGVTTSQPPMFHNAARIVQGTRCLLRSANSEPELGFVLWGGISFQVRRVLRGRRELEVDKLANRFREARYQPDDAIALGRDLGRLFASGHSRCGNASAIVRAVSDAGDATQLAERFATAVAIDHQRLLRDLDLFRRARLLRGPLLGARPQ